jgi:uncharacterized protein (TIGR02145 family)
MESLKVIKILSLGIITTSLYCCKPEEIILHGDLSGDITDALTSQLLEAVKVKVIGSDDSTLTGNDGKYLLRNIIPGNVEVQSSKYSYITKTENVNVKPAENTVANFALDGIPVPLLDKIYFDFGSEGTTLSFTISCHGPKKLTYILTPSQDWITVPKATGQITDGTDTITVNLNRAGLPEKTYKENIKITSVYGQDHLDLSLRVYLNGVIDQDGNYYNIVKIGNQTWMAENLNVGIMISNTKIQIDNDTIEKWCLNGDCSVYGGYYSWEEATQLYNPTDTGEFGPVQGVCPDGWHIPTHNDWELLEAELISEFGSGSAGKLKESGYAHWLAPNYGATNETGFTALPGGSFSMHQDVQGHQYVGLLSYYSSSKLIGKWIWNNKWDFDAEVIHLANDNAGFYYGSNFYQNGSSVRCIKDP